MLAAFAVSLAVILGTREAPVDPSDAETVLDLPESSSILPPELSPTELPQAELRSALTDLCRSDRKQAADKDSAADEIQAATDALNILRQNISGLLSVSSSTEHLHLAALIEDDSASQIKLLERAISQSPNDAFLLWRAMQICSDEKDATGCDLLNWERRLLTVDGQNSESWLRVAANRYKAGETDAALEAMRHAATAAETRIYWIETIEMVERGLAAAGSDYAFAERVRMAFGLAAAQVPSYGDFTTMCREQSLRSADWAYTCLGYGELAENQSKTDIGVSIGRAIQKLALEALGEEDKLAAVEARRQSSRQERLVGIGKNYLITERVMFSNPAVFSAYLTAVRTHGEAGARAYLADETSRLLREQPELACEP